MSNRIAMTRSHASAQQALPNPSSLRISLPEPDVKADIRGVVGMCTVMIVLLSTFVALS